MCDITSNRTEVYPEKEQVIPSISCSPYLLEEATEDADLLLNLIKLDDIERVNAVLDKRINRCLDDYSNDIKERLTILNLAKTLFNELNRLALDDSIISTFDIITELLQSKPEIISCDIVMSEIVVLKIFPSELLMKEELFGYDPSRFFSDYEILTPKRILLTQYVKKENPKTIQEELFCKIYDIFERMF